MDDLISRKALIAEYDRVHIGEPGMARKLIEDAPAIQKWIPVTERLPEDNERVIAYRPMEADASAYKYCVMWGWSVKGSMRHGGITHWMPLPEPPKGE